MPLQFNPTKIPDVVVVEPQVFGDQRGWFAETFKRSAFEAAGIRADFRQDNHSHSTGRGVLRGLHFQIEPMAQGKLVRCLAGEIIDVAVDIRKGSPTYGEWVGEILSAANHRMLWVPPGFAHGFQTLSEVTDVAYKVTNEYSSAHEGAIRWNDPALAIAWPIANPVMNARDAEAPTLGAAQNPFTWRPGG